MKITMYNNYEEYMQSVLGMNMQNTYPQYNPAFYEPRMQEPNLTEINKLYPEIYGVVYPMIQKACGKRNIVGINDTQINEMVEEIYNAIEINEIPENRNAETKNTREKETRRPNNNYLLRDLIRILIIRELLQGGNHMPRPPMPCPGGNCGMPGGRPPIMRPGYMGMY